MTTHSAPRNYNEWRHCIIVKCGLELSPVYISERLKALNDEQDYHTQRFVQLYGKAHHQNVIEWFMQAQGDSG